MKQFHRIGLVLVIALLHGEGRAFELSSEAISYDFTDNHSEKSQDTTTDNLASQENPLEIFNGMKKKVKVFSEDSSVAKRRAANHRFVQDMVRLVKSGKSWDMPWSELSPVSVLMTPDQKWRILTWSVLLEQNSRRHYGCVLGQKGNFYPLIDQLANRFENDEIFDNRHWPGAVYFQILPITPTHNNKICYALLGYDAREPFAQRKVLDWLCPDPEEGMVHIGAPLIDYAGRSLSRWQLLYPRDVQVQFQWDKDRSLVYFDHLISRGSDPSTETFDFIPDGSFDALVWRNRRLVFEEMPMYQPLK